MKTTDEYIMFIQWHWYSFIEWTGEWLVSPAMFLGPLDNVVISVGHILLAFFVVVTIAWCVTIIRLQYPRH